MRQRVARPIKLADAARNFAKGYKKKSQENQSAVDEALRHLERDLYYPSLRARKITGGRDVWEARASDSVRLTFEFADENSVRLRNCCTHDIYRNP